MKPLPRSPGEKKRIERSLKRYAPMREGEEGGEGGGERERKVLLTIKKGGREGGREGDGVHGVGLGAEKQR
jgi:hypothetical protein